MLWGLVACFGVALFSTVGVFLAADIIRGSWPEIVNGHCIYYSEEDDLELMRERAEAATGVVYLTFDDGPSDYTAQLLDVLKKYNVKATFFVTGGGDDALIEREYREGHALGSHTASHNYAYIYSNTDNFWADVTLVQERIRRITGQTTWLMRFPGGSSNTVSRRYDGRQHIMSILTEEAGAKGWKYFDWNLDSGDAGGARDENTVYERVVSGLRAGDNVVLQHDVKDYSVAAVERIIRYGQENGYIFLPLDMSSFDAHHGVNN